MSYQEKNPRRPNRGPLPVSNNWRKSRSLLHCALLSGISIYSNLSGETSVEIVSGWDSKYVSEGQDNLDDGGIGSIAADWRIPTSNNSEIVVAGWYADALEDNYTELNIGASYGWSLDHFDLSLGYTWLDFAEDNASDNEFSLEIATSLFNNLDFSTALTYSDEAGGTFIEFAVSRSYLEGEVTWSPYLLLGINGGYVTDRADGLNNLQMGLEVSTPLSDNVEIAGYAAYTIGLHQGSEEALDDLIWLGVSLRWKN